MTTLERVYEIHPLAHLLPSMRDDEFTELKEDIAANGLRESIKLYEDKVLDGRHRYRACTELDVCPTFEIYDGDEPAGYVLSLNVKRRQLTPSQKAMLATDFLPHLEAEARANLPEVGRAAAIRQQGGLVSEEHNPPTGLGRSRERAAEQIGVSHAQVGRAKHVKENNPELAEQVRQGAITVTAAYDRVTGRRPLDNTNGGSDRSRKRSDQHLLENVIAKVLGISAALEHIDTAAAIAGADGSLSKWDKDLTDIIVPLHRLRGDIRKVLGND